MKHMKTFFLALGLFASAGSAGLMAQDCTFTSLVGIDDYLKAEGDPELYDGNGDIKTGMIRVGDREEIYQWVTGVPVSMTIRGVDDGELPVETLAYIVEANGGTEAWEIEFETTLTDSGSIYQGWKRQDDTMTLQVIYGESKKLVSVELRSNKGAKMLRDAIEESDAEGTFEARDSE
jgi:hypothetical protein